MAGRRLVPSILATSLVLAVPVTAAHHVKVPKLVGLKSSVARERLAARGLHVLVRTVVSTKGVGIVVSQRPSAGTAVAENAVVRLAVSRGSPPTGEVIAPDVVGELRDTAEQRISAAGLSPNVVYVASLQLVGTVIAQEPAGGARVVSGAQVTISISSGPGP